MMARFTIPAERFPFKVTPIRTEVGLVDFIDQAAEVDDETLAAALRGLPAVFGIAEDGVPPARDEEPAAGGEAERPPSVRAPKADWVAYASRWHDNREELEAMTKAELVETFGG